MGTPDAFNDNNTFGGDVPANIETFDESEEQEELVEPRFRYKRVLGDLMRLLENDPASCFTIHEKLMVVGFQSGRVCIFDHLGNVNIDSCCRYHKCAVSSISIDDSANYIITCANDFSIVIYGIGCSEYNQRISLTHSCKVVAIAGNFSRPSSGQRFLAASQNLVLYQRGVRAEFFSGKRRETTLYKGNQNDGLINCLTWRDPFVAFTNETGTRIYDLLNDSTLAIGWASTVCVCAIVHTTKRPGPNTSDLLLDLPKGQIIHRFTFNDFAIAGISFTTRSSYGNDEVAAPLPHSIHSPTSQTSQSDWRELIIFGIKKSGDTREPSLLNFTNCAINGELREEINNNNTKNNAPSSTCSNDFDDQNSNFSAQLRLIKPISLQEYSLEAEDTIEMRNVNIKMLNRFGLVSLPLDDIYILGGPREAIEALPCSIDNRIQWLMENGLFEDALESALRNSELLRENTVLDVGKRLLNHLIEKQDFETAANYLPEICSKYKEEWEYYVNEFERHNQVLKLIPVIPTKDPQLEPENYESILNAALYSRPKLFHAIVSHWDADIYRAGSLVAEVFKRITTDNINKNMIKVHKDVPNSVQLLSENDRVCLLRALASLLLQCRKYEDAIKTYILLQDPTIFGVIDRYKLFPYVKDQIMELMEINQDLAIRLLLDNEDLISQDKVVNLLGNYPKIQLAYLHRLQARGEGMSYSNRLVKLYADHERPSLLPFLRKNEHYKLDLALDVCKKREFIEEVVYLLGRSGNRLEALDLMVNKLLRIDMAIDFCAENDDYELWERLIESSIKRPEQITILLRRMACLNIDSISVVEKIPTNMDIPDLQNCLLQVIRDHEQQRDLLIHSKNVANSDVLKLLELQLKPLAINFGLNNNRDEEENNNNECFCCDVCNQTINNGSTEEDTNNSNNILLLANGKIIHEKCTENGQPPTQIFPNCYPERISQLLKL
uniref:RING-type domain-containing protein n=1 Tax=Meloidogyne hapla TaxID=6305 RepID=A0A1I8BSP0_MELHA